MFTVVFECCENMGQFKEEFVFEDGTTDQEVQEEFESWVWEQVGDKYAWYKK